MSPDFYEYTKADGTEIELELYYSNPDESTVEVIEKPDGTFIVGYLALDEECSSPEDGVDGAGFIGTSSRRDSREANEIFQEALGLTSDWERKVDAHILLDELAYDLDKNWDQLLRDPNKGASRDNLKLPYRGKWDALLEAHRKAGDLGDPDAVTLDVYEHGGRVYSVGYNHGFPDRQWDCAYGGAVWVPDDYLRNTEAKGLTGKARREKMEEWARQHVETMNAWMEGDCWGVIIQENDSEGQYIESEDGWGIIGSDWAEKELAMSMKVERERLSQPVQA